MEAPFFERYLKDRAGFELKNTASFRTGVNKWERYDVWPPKEGFRAEKLYLIEGWGIEFRGAEGGWSGGFVCSRSGESDSLSEQADSADVW